MCLYLSKANIELQPSYECHCVPHTYAHSHWEKTHILSFYLGFKQDGRRTLHSHTLNETFFPWSAVLSPPQGSGCRLVHSRMGMTQCLQALLWMPPQTPHPHPLPPPPLHWDLSVSLIPHFCRKEVGLRSHWTHTQWWRISVTFQTLENNDPVEEALHLQPLSKSEAVREERRENKNVKRQQIRNFAETLQVKTVSL